MAYWKQTKTGRRIILTAKDHAIQNVRREQKKGIWRTRRLSARTFSRKAHQRTLDYLYRSINPFEKQVQAIIADREESLAKLRVRLHATLKWKRLGQHSKDVSLTGDVNYVRAEIAIVENDLLFWMWMATAPVDGRL